MGGVALCAGNSRVGLTLPKNSNARDTARHAWSGTSGALENPLAGEGVDRPSLEAGAVVDAELPKIAASGGSGRFECSRAAERFASEVASSGERRGWGHR